MFGRYEIRQEIGRGGMAHVYLAFDPAFRREVAVKVLPPHYLENPLLRARFEREARLIATIEHPAIVPVYDFGEQENQLYLVMRYMSGGSLVDRIRQGPLTLAQATEHLSLLAPALDAVHARDIVHRDLKPGNILLDAFGNPALSDFGIAHLSEATVDLTGEAIIGTPAYMSPEQVRGDVTLDGRSDIYSLGIILFELLTGRQPYQATTPMSAAMRHLTDPIPQICLARPELPASLQTVLERALAKDRDQRYARATDMAFDLRALVDAAPSQAQVPGTLPPAATEVDTRPGGSTTPAAVTEVDASPPNSAAAPTGSQPPELQASQTTTNLRWLGLIGGVLVLAVLAFLGIRMLLGSGASPTPSPTPTPAFADDFTAPANGWPQGSQPGGGYSYQDGSYLISVQENGSLFWAAPDPSFTDQQIEVQARRLAGDQGYYGIVCRLQESGDYYYFVVRPDGYYTIGLYMDGEFQAISPRGWTFHEAVHTGASPNQLQADCAGDRLSFTVNGVLLEEVTNPALSAGKPGLLAAALDDLGFQAQFDEFRVFSPVP